MHVTNTCRPSSADQKGFQSVTVLFVIPDVACCLDAVQFHFISSKFSVLLLSSEFIIYLPIGRLGMVDYAIILVGV